LGRTNGGRASVFGDVHTLLERLALVGLLPTLVGLLLDTNIVAFARLDLVFDLAQLLGRLARPLSGYFGGVPE
jgi:hypothetical protein